MLEGVSPTAAAARQPSKPRRIAWHCGLLMPAAALAARYLAPEARLSPTPRANGATVYVSLLARGKALEQLGELARLVPAPCETHCPVAASANHGVTSGGGEAV
jgi:hypothetical protein